MNHEVVVGAWPEWFAVEVAVDVVLDLAMADGIELVVAGGDACRLECVADGVESW